jgi:beta-galactosidase
MVFKLRKWSGKNWAFKAPGSSVLSIFLSLCFALSVQSAIVQGPVPDVLNRETNMNMAWQFYKGDPAGTPSATNFNDSASGWSTVVAPHSCSYDAAPIVVNGVADWASEWNYYKGNCWYRKTFGVPASAKKLFIEFEGAMQVATVYVNGVQVGQHINSGYTPFYYDISNRVTRGANNVIAVMLNNAVNNDIPPGTQYTSQTGGQRPDYLLYSGLYRSVWLHAKDSVYIPIYSQQVRTDNVSASSAQVHAITPVRNEALTAKNVTVTVTLFDAAHSSVVTKSATSSVAANTLDTVDILTDAISNPHLWSPSSPYMYSVQTLVSVGGVVVDSVVEPCGFRWITWAAGSGGSFNLNGSRLEIRGMCVHQFQGWVENAVPATRFYQEVKLLKNMGCNSIRCSHYPRAQAFYDACDKLGMLVYVEQPSWGWGYSPSALCWARMDSCVREMVLSGRNHPCIYAWGLYNEPDVTLDFTSQITPLNNTAHQYDPTRFTAEANGFGTANAAARVPDIEGLNYVLTGDAGAYRWLGTESRSGFYYASYRGSSLDLDTTTDNTEGSAYFEWQQMSYTLNTSGQLSGGHFWCFKDYNSPYNINGNEGVVDRLTVPKTIFYMFRKYWTGAAPDYPKSVTPTTIQLLSDTLGPLHANGADVFLLTATLRDGAGNQSSSANGNVTYTVAPASAATIFGGNVQPAYAGRAGAFLRTTTTPGTITVTAAYGSLPTASITLITVQDTNQAPPFGAVSVKTPLLSQYSPDAYKLNIGGSSKNYLFHCPAASAGRLSVLDCQGRTVFAADAAQGATVVMHRRTLGTGVYYGVWDNGARRVISCVNSVY